MRLLVASLAVLPLASCQVAQSDGTAPGPIAGTCRPAELDQFTGQETSQALGERILAASGARLIRWVPKGGMVTMEYSAERVTVQLDGANRVERASCG